MDESVAAAIKKAARIMYGSREVLVFTGAGISAESGIPTFRGEGGIWEEYNPAVFGNIPGLALAFLAAKSKLAFLPGTRCRPSPGRSRTRATMQLPGWRG